MLINLELRMTEMVHGFQPGLTSQVKFNFKLFCELMILTSLLDFILRVCDIFSFAF